ncbi:septum formation family protein [Natronosporangium hydrolyticum]|uniref:Septum formation family protein n=1 Tax=Natronosporangium hydrolyticum TaxID=2811111 RepID=A0A895YC62_9ACTN|nr:septum formation family protein [Natronosporangium hydrolyticum]QSB15051.1 septum formation family protein [Natronosporangium hydrolyticum]
MDKLARRWLAAAGGAVLFLLAACGDDLPAGVDGDLTNDWGALGEPIAFAPGSEECHARPYQPVAPLTEYEPVECDEPHLVQTVHVGSFDDDAFDDDAFDEGEAGLAAPPDADSTAHRTAFSVCEEHAAEFLGADHRHGRLWLGVALPAEAAWEGGARWFRCDVMEVSSVYGEPVERTGSLAGSLGGDDADPELRLGCYQVEVDDGAVAAMDPVSCDEPHDAEFVGVYRADGGDYPDPSDDSAEDQVYEGCREQVAGYVDVPVDDDLVFRTGTVADWMSESDWQGGDRGFRCYLWLPEEELTESLAGAGEDALPVQTE